MAFLFESYGSLLLPPLAYEIPFVQMHNVSFELLVQGNFASFLIELSPVFVHPVIVEFLVLLLVEPVFRLIYVLLDEVCGFKVGFLV